MCLEQEQQEHKPRSKNTKLKFKNHKPRNTKLRHSYIFLIFFLNLGVDVAFFNAKIKFIIIIIILIVPSAT